MNKGHCLNIGDKKILAVAESLQSVPVCALCLSCLCSVPLMCFCPASTFPPWPQEREFSTQRMLSSTDPYCELNTKEKYRGISETKGASKLRVRAEPDVAMAVDLASSLFTCTRCVRDYGFGQLTVHMHQMWVWPWIWLAHCSHAPYVTVVVDLVSSLFTYTRCGRGRGFG